MCCLFGLIDYRGTLTAKQKTRLIRELSIAAEVRGTDATGIAYNTEHGLQIYKRPIPAHRLRLNIPSNAKVIMGHTRMATQGRAKKNENNHPFRGSIEGKQFALAHNGVLYNDYQLRRLLRLPASKIETDSYIAVQLLEQKNTLDPSSLKYMAEQVEGSFTFTVLTYHDRTSRLRGWGFGAGGFRSAGGCGCRGLEPVFKSGRAHHGERASLWPDASLGKRRSGGACNRDSRER